MMKKLKMLWMPVLLGALLMATLVGVAGARPNAKPEASPALVDYMFSAHHCIPEQDYDWDFGAMFLTSLTGESRFVCPIKPPHQGLIRVQRLALYAYDNDATAGEKLCVKLVQTYPKAATFVERLSLQCTTDNAADPAVYAYNPANFKVSVVQDIYAYTTVTPGERLYGLKLKYEPL
jgi:hypothetical protein